MSDPDIPTWLRRQLARREWSPADFARKLGVPNSRVSEWLTGTRHPSTRTCIRFAEALSVDPDTVLAIAGHRAVPAPLDDPKADLIALISRADLSPGMISAITSLVLDFMRNRDPSDSLADHSS